MCLSDLPKLGRNQSELVSRNFETEQATPMTNQAAAGRRKTKYPYLVSFSHPELIGNLQLIENVRAPPIPHACVTLFCSIHGLQQFVSICASFYCSTNLSRLLTMKLYNRGNFHKTIVATVVVGIALAT